MPSNEARRTFRKATVLAGLSTFAIIASAAAQERSTASGNQPEEIIVTAQRRSERLQDVPVAIISQSAAKLEQASVTRIEDLENVAPGVHMAGGGINIAPSIRGVFSAQSDPGNDGNIAIYVDDVYQASQIANALEFPDVDHIEILKGPQGTLFGRNAAGGAIRVFTIEPNLQTTTGQITAGYGSFNEFLTKGYISTPLVTDKLAMMASAYYERSDGFDRDIVHNKGDGGTRNTSGRVKFLLTPTDNLRVELFGTYRYKRDDNDQAYTVLNGSTVARIFDPNVVVPTAPHTFTAVPDNHLKAMRWEWGGKITWNTEWGDLISNTAWSRTHTFYDLDADMTVLDVVNYPAFQRQNDIQSEVLFNTKKFHGVQATVGANYYGDTGRYDPLIVQGVLSNFPGGAFTIYGRQRTDAYAGFADATIDLTDALSIIGGVRYTSEKRTANSGFDDVRGHEPFLGKAVFKSTTPRASIKYRLDEAGDNTYFTFSQGFKSGGFNISGAQAAPFLPEKVTAYELGLKTATSRIISGNLSAFYYDYTNQQVEQNTGFTNITANAAKSRMYGFDGDITARVTDEFTVNVSFAYLDAKFKNFANATITVPIPGCPLCGGANGVGDLSGFVEPFSPKFTGGVGVNYHKDFEFGLVDIGANLYYSSRYHWDAQGLIVNPRYADLAMTASYTPTGSHFTFGVWGRNLTNATYFRGVFPAATANGISYAEPTAGGFTVKYTY